MLLECLLPSQVVQAALGSLVAVDPKDRGETQVRILMVLKVFLEIRAFLDLQVSLDHRAVHQTSSPLDYLVFQVTLVREDFLETEALKGLKEKMVTATVWVEERLVHRDLKGLRGPQVLQASVV